MAGGSRCRHGAKASRRVPPFLARLNVGEFGIVMMTEIRGASSAGAKEGLARCPIYPSWREGFRKGFGTAGDT